jgi:hypothetical protein
MGIRLPPFFGDEFPATLQYRTHLSPHPADDGILHFLALARPHNISDAGEMALFGKQNCAQMARPAN